ncbi:MarR family winged helix-turn-helix transcriptional regulator [Sphingomonas morindae]|uniref:MarR family transcriptional regulator n=1 Tax=Sphingomonas morindae TaxID=1541170 RepID=A0ABY4X6H1_9SPHN|nr:MarR family transcriptional regulator [Sphingomonas morindae]USI72518.1 MarR family transcriptional regulator [Sphingomonas morindae]
MAVMTPEDCATSRAPGRLIRRINKVMTGLVAMRFEDRDLSFEQWIALKTTHEGMVGNAGELARELDITSGATTRMIDGLEARGLMRRVRDGGDRRVVQLVVTEAGAEAVQALYPRVVGMWNEVLAGFSEAEVHDLSAALVKLLDAALGIAAQAESREAAE